MTPYLCLPVLSRPDPNSWAPGTAEKGRWPLWCTGGWCDVTASQALRMLRCFDCIFPAHHRHWQRPWSGLARASAGPVFMAMSGHVNTIHTMLTHHPPHVTRWSLHHKMYMSNHCWILCHQGQCHFLDRLQTTGERNTMNCCIKNLFSAKFCGRAKTILEKCWRNFSARLSFTRKSLKESW